MGKVNSKEFNKRYEGRLAEVAREEVTEALAECPDCDAQVERTEASANLTSSRRPR